MVKHPLVSVGIPTYNRPQGLQNTLDGLLQQTYKNLEIIISDNCSTDINVQIIAEKFSKIDQRISYFRQIENIQAEPNFNFVFSQSQGKYFIWMSDDDYYENNYIESCVEFLERNSDFIHAVGLTHYKKNNLIHFTESNDSIVHSNATVRILQYLWKVRKNGLFYGVFRRSIPLRNPIANSVGADWCFVAQLAALGKVKRLPSTSYTRSLDGMSASRSSIVKRWSATGLKRIFFESYVAYKVAVGIPIGKNNVFRNFHLVAISFILLHFKFIRNSILKRIDPNYI